LPRLHFCIFCLEEVVFVSLGRVLGETTAETVINVGWGLEGIRLSVYLNFPRMYGGFGVGGCGSGSGSYLCP